MEVWEGGKRLWLETSPDFKMTVITINYVKK